MYRAWARARILNVRRQIFNTRETSSPKWNTRNLSTTSKTLCRVIWTNTATPEVTFFITSGSPKLRSSSGSFLSWKQISWSPWSLLRIKTVVFRPITLLESSTWKSSYPKCTCSKIARLDTSLEVTEKGSNNSPSLWAVPYPRSCARSLLDGIKPVWYLQRPGALQPPPQQQQQQQHHHIGQACLLPSSLAYVPRSRRSVEISTRDLLEEEEEEEEKEKNPTLTFLSPRSLRRTLDVLRSQRFRDLRLRWTKLELVLRTWVCACFNKSRRVKFWTPICHSFSHYFIEMHLLSFSWNFSFSDRFYRFSELRIQIFLC